MRAKVVTAFNGWGENEPEPRDYQPGEILGEKDPNLAYQAATTKVDPDKPDSPMYAEWEVEPTIAERDVRGDSRTQPKPLYTIQPVGTERPAKGDHPELMARLDAHRAQMQERQRLEDEANQARARAAQSDRERMEGQPLQRAEAGVRPMQPNPLGNNPPNPPNPPNPREPPNPDPDNQPKRATSGEGVDLDLKGKMGKKS